MNPQSKRRALTPIQESEESQSSSGKVHSDLSSAASPGTSTGRTSLDDELCLSPQPPEMGDSEGQSSPLECGEGDGTSPTSQSEHDEMSAPHDHHHLVLGQHGVLDQQPVALPPESPPPHKTTWPQTNKRHSEDNIQAEGQKKQRKKRGASTPPEPSLPLWLVSLMHNIEEATHHELVIE